jgi:hypothetical protein
MASAIAAPKLRRRRGIVAPAITSVGTAMPRDFGPKIGIAQRLAAASVAFGEVASKVRRNAATVAGAVRRKLSR